MKVIANIAISEFSNTYKVSISVHADKDENYMTTYGHIEDSKGNQKEWTCVEPDEVESYIEKIYAIKEKIAKYASEMRKQRLELAKNQKEFEFTV